MKKTTEQYIKEIFNYIIDNGLENTSIRDMCNNLDVSIGSLYYHFKSKEGVIISVGIYGFNKIIDELFDYAISTISETKIFFETFLDFVKPRQNELRVVCQIASSPIYGNTMRKSLKNKKIQYEKYIERLSNVVRISKEELTPILYMVISIILDYAVCDNYKGSKMQMDTLNEFILKKDLIK